MSVEIDIQGDKKLMDALSSLSDKEIARAAVAAGKRAATAARQAGTKEIRSIYTMKAGDLKAKAQIRADEDGATILVKGAPEAIHKYQAKKRRDGVFVSVKRGKMTHVPRGFSWAGHSSPVRARKIPAERYLWAGGAAVIRQSRCPERHDGSWQ